MASFITSGKRWISVLFLLVLFPAQITSNHVARTDDDDSNPLTASPPFNGWLVLDGIDDYAESEDDSELDVGDDTGESLTLEAWVNFYSFYHAGILYKPLAYFLYADTDLSGARCIGINLWYEPGKSCGFMHCRRPGPALGWHHVAGVYDKTSANMRLYLDGEDFGGPYSCPTISNSDERLRVGQGWWIGGESLAGEVDEIRISDVVRYSAPFPPPATSLACDASTRALWHFNELEGATQFNDSCGSVNNILIGYNGAHSAGVPVRRFFLPIATRPE